MARNNKNKKNQKNNNTNTLTSTMNNATTSGNGSVVIDSKMIANLNAMASQDPKLYSLMQKVVKGTATPEEVEQFKAYISMAQDMVSDDTPKNTSNLTKISNVTLTFTYDVDRVSRCMYKAFESVPANDFLMKKFFNVSIDEYCSQYRIHAYMHLINAHFYDNGAEFIQANNFHAVAIWTAPEILVKVPRTNDETFNKVFFDDLEEVKQKVLPNGMKYYYLFCIGRDPDDVTTKGSVRSIFEYYKERADRENVAICLEAISDKARSVYEYFGFKNYKTFKYGVGEVDSKGHVDKNGEGFTGYLMIYHKDAEKLFNKL
ncbi:uncharacterized protein PWA37_000087 [Arxiozyma heterogenica]|uniref:uncharacterized protein n=1 Tax=Arxiozyma heterogenica TaxID=278026 RepID=UPI002F0322F8